MADTKTSADTVAGTLDGTEAVAVLQVGSPITAGSFAIGTAYFILSIGSTDFTTIGATSNTVGLLFTATGVGSGSGTAGAADNRRTTAKAIAGLSAGGLYGAQLTTPPALSTFTQRNGSGATFTNSSIGPNISAPQTTGPNIRACTIAAPSTPYTIDALLAIDAELVNYVISGLCFTDSTKYSLWGIGANSGGVLRQLDYTSATVFSTGPFNFLWSLLPPLVWLRVNDDGTNINFSSSADGVNWTVRRTVLKSSGFLGASGYSNVGFFTDPEMPSVNSHNSSVTLLSWLVH